MTVAERDDFESRLRQAQAKRTPDTRASGQAALPKGSMGLGFRVGVELVSAVVVGSVVGFLLDRWLGTLPLFFLVFFALGSAAGVLNVMRVFGKAEREKPGPR
jgi:ATP synthase protein I